MSEKNEIFKLKMKPAKCAVDLGDGSERGEYVNQDYIIQKLGRPHRSINLMYCYYPLDKGWPVRASKAFANSTGTFAWDYPYDDYFPYEGGPFGNIDGEPFKQMRDIRMHGQDITLTMTFDCAVDDTHLRKIAQELKPYGRLLLRINHEATGDWFAYNKRYSYQEVADFYTRFHKIIKEETPHIQTILCIGGGPEKEPGKMAYEKEFTEAAQVTDIWSGDYYLALNWGWPYTIAEPSGKTHKRYNVKSVFDTNRFSFERFKTLCNGIEKPLVISEFNADGDVVGPYEQAEMVKEFYDLVKENEATWLAGITLYQFRDRGRLGLEIQDPNNEDNGIEQPILSTYRDIIHDSYFMPEFEATQEASLPAKLRWGGFEDSEGLLLKKEFEKSPIFCEINFENAEQNIMIEINGQWFFKKPGVKSVDLMSAFYKKPLKGKETVDIKLFALPRTGVNEESQGEDWIINYYETLEKLPDFRIRYTPTEVGEYSP